MENACRFVKRTIVIKEGYFVEGFYAVITMTGFAGYGVA